jgi:hypothetical protein
METVFNGRLYQAVLPNLVPLIYEAERKEHKVALLFGLETGTHWYFRDYAPGVLKLLWDAEAWILGTTDYANRPVYFRLQPDPRFHFRVERKSENDDRWMSPISSYRGMRRSTNDDIKEDVRFFLPRDVFFRYSAPWSFR